MKNKLSITKLILCIILVLICTILFLPKTLGESLPNVERIELNESGWFWRKIDVIGYNDQNKKIYQKTIFGRSQISTVDSHPFYLITDVNYAEVIDLQNQSIYRIHIKYPLYSGGVLPYQVKRTNGKTFLIVYDQPNQYGSVNDRIYWIQPNQDQTLKYEEGIAITGTFDSLEENQDGSFLITSHYWDSENIIKKQIVKFDEQESKS